MESWLSRVLPWLPYASVAGVVAVVVNLAFSFEEPHGMLIVAALVLLLAAPVGLVMHLGTTSELTGAEKALWWAGLASWKAPTLFPAYFRKQTRGLATLKLREAKEVQKA